MSIKTIQDVHQFLDRRPAFKEEGAGAAELNLQRFAEFCRLIGNPHRQYPSVHVGGTNGKGSTVKLIAAAYRQAGLRVGVFTSPHMRTYADRVTVNGVMIPEQALVQFFSTYEEPMKAHGLTYFEISTALAFWWFQQSKVAIAVIEVGLGGRLDATNIITPLAAVITTVAFDHTDILGDTIPQIAAEKGGIIKQKVPVILGDMPAEASQVLRTMAAERHAPVIDIASRSHQVHDDGFTIAADSGLLRLKTPIRAPVQRFNIAMAYQTIQRLQNFKLVSDEEFQEAMAHFYDFYPSDGRFEKMHPQREWYFDGAHNLQAVQELKKSLRRRAPISSYTLVLAMLGDKITKKMMIEFSEFEKIVYHTLSTKRAASITEIRNWLPRVIPFPESDSSRIDFLNDRKHDSIVFAGSLYFYSTVKAWIAQAN